MIAVASFQLRAGQSLTGKRASECATGLLSLCAKRRHRRQQKYWDQLFHAPVLEQGRRFVETHSRPRPPGVSPMSQDVRSASALAFGRVMLSAKEVQRHVRLITNDPAVVRHRRNVQKVACVKLNYATIVERNCRGSRENEPDVFNGTTRRANARADVLTPFPPGLIRRTTNCDSAEVDHLEFAFLHHAHFIRSVERFQNDRYLLAVHPLHNIENLLLEIKSNFSHFLAISYGLGKALRDQAIWCWKDKGSP